MCLPKRKEEKVICHTLRVFSTVLQLCFLDGTQLYLYLTLQPQTMRGTLVSILDNFLPLLLNSWHIQLQDNWSISFPYLSLFVHHCRDCKGSSCPVSQTRKEMNARCFLIFPRLSNLNYRMVLPTFMVDLSTSTIPSRNSHGQFQRDTRAVKLTVSINHVILKIDKFCEDIRFN